MRVTASRPARPAVLPGWPRPGVTEQQRHPDGDGQRRRDDDDGPDHDESPAAVSMAAANARAFTPSNSSTTCGRSLGADRTRHVAIVAHTYDHADRCVCGLGGDELMCLLVGHPEHFPDVTDGYTLAGQVLG
jgi:hypothetical protein